MMKVLCVNGPPRAGKDTLGEIITDGIYGQWCGILKFADPIRSIVKLILNIDDETFNHLMDSDKNAPMVNFGYDISIRQLMINVSEDLIKPSLGETWFAEQMVNRIISSDLEVIVITDSGFQHEFDKLKELLDGTADVKLIRITRDGCNYDNDSREYVNNPDYYIANDGNIDHLKRQWTQIKGGIL